MIKIFALSTFWLAMEIFKKLFYLIASVGFFCKLTLQKKMKNWVKNAIDLLKTAPDHYLVQRFLRTLKDYTVCYQGPRSLAEQSGIEAKDNFSISKPQGLEGKIYLFYYQLYTEFLEMGWKLLFGLAYQRFFPSRSHYSHNIFKGLSTYIRSWNR